MPVTPQMAQHVLIQDFDIRIFPKALDIIVL